MMKNKRIPSPSLQWISSLAILLMLYIRENIAKMPRKKKKIKAPITIKMEKPMKIKNSKSQNA